MWNCSLRGRLSGAPRSAVLWLAEAESGAPDSAFLFFRVLTPDYRFISGINDIGAQCLPPGIKTVTKKMSERLVLRCSFRTCGSGITLRGSIESIQVC